MVAKPPPHIRRVPSGCKKRVLSYQWWIRNVASHYHKYHLRKGQISMQVQGHFRGHSTSSTHHPRLRHHMQTQENIPDRNLEDRKACRTSSLFVNKESLLKEGTRSIPDTSQHTSTLKSRAYTSHHTLLATTTKIKCLLWDQIN